MAKRRTTNTIADVKAMLRGETVEWKEPIEVNETSAPTTHRKVSPEVESLRDALAKHEVTETPQLEDAAKQAETPLTVVEQGKATVVAPKAPMASPAVPKRDPDKKG